MFKVVPFWEFCMLVYSMFLLKFCQISVLHSLVFLTVCSSLILLGFSFCCSKNPTFGHKRFKALQVKFFAWGKCVFFSVFVLKFNIFNIYANFQYLYKSSSIFVLNLQYLCKFSIFIVYLRIFVILSLVCVQADLSSFRSQREGLLFRFCTTCVLSSLWSVYKQICLSFRSQREGILSFLLVFAFFIFL